MFAFFARLGFVNPEGLATQADALAALRRSM